MSTWVWIDGRVVPASTEVIAASDRGLLLGDGVFETVSVTSGQPFALTRHLARLRASANRVALALPWDDGHLRMACAAALDAASSDAVDGPPGRLRITITAGAGAAGPHRSAETPTLVVTAGPAVVRDPTAAVATSPWALNDRSPVVGVKTISQIEHVMALADATQRGADEAVLANTRGFLAEGTGSNVFLVVGGRLTTPSLATGCLAGVTRGLVCEVVEVAERDDLTIDDLHAAPEAFLTSTTRGVHPIRRVDGRRLVSVPGPLTTAAKVAFDALRTRTMDP